MDHLEDIDVLLNSDYDEMPGENVIESGIDVSTDVIPEREITDADLQQTGDSTEDWLLYGGSYSNIRHYPGDELNTDSVADLSVEWSYTNEDAGGNQQGSHSLVGGDPPILYDSDAPGQLLAYNARTGDLIWHHTYESNAGIGFSPPAERGVGLYGDMVLRSTLDLGVIALDRYTGETIWYYNGAAAYRDEPAENLMHEELVWGRFSGTTSNHPPMVYDGRILKGSFGGEYGVKGFYDGIDLDGVPQWRVNMCPEVEWVGDSWKHGGGTAWAASCIDVENDQVIIPSANGGPWYGTVRPGFNPYTCGKVAVDTETGEYNWHYQDVPNDWWDYDSPSPALTYTAEVNGEERRLVSWAPKVGWVFTVDAETGELHERSEGYVQHHNTYTLPAKGDLERSEWFMPQWTGGTNPQPSSYDPNTQTMVVRGNNVPARFAWNEAEYSTASFYFGMQTQTGNQDDVEEYNGSGGNVAAVDPVTGEVKWQDWFSNAPSGGSMTTAGGVAFSGADGQTFVAYDIETGERLFEHDLNGAPSGSPIAWEDPAEGKAYVSISDASGTTTVFSVATN